MYSLQRRAGKRHMDPTVQRHHTDIGILQHSHLHLHMPHLAHEDQHSLALLKTVPGSYIPQYCQSRDRLLLCGVDFLPHCMCLTMSTSQLCVDILGR